MSYGWSGGHEPKSVDEVNVVTPVGAADCKATITRVDDDLFILTLDGGGHVTIQGTRDELRQWAVRLLLRFTQAVEEAT